MKLRLKTIEIFEYRNREFLKIHLVFGNFGDRETFQ